MSKIRYTGQCTVCGGDMYSYLDNGNWMTGCEDCGFHRDDDYEPVERYEEPWERTEPDLSDQEPYYYD